MSDGLGVHAMWGFSPAEDLQANWLRDLPESNTDGNDPLNILLVDSGDIRHVMATISRRRRHSDKPVHIYMHDQHIECTARHLLLLQIMHDWELPVRQRTSAFLEVFGNAFVQERTASYIASKGRELSELALDGQGAMADVVDLSLLKSRQRDDLHTTFRSWDESVPFDVELLRDTRLRRFYGTRYDARKNLIDWDYQMCLKQHCDASIIHIRQFREWRMSGIAFEFTDQQYTAPNRSMASYAEGRERGGTTQRRGLWLDVVIGPYIGFGVDCDRVNAFAEGLFKIHNKGSGTEQHRHNTVEVAVYNVLSYLWEIETGHMYQMSVEHDIYSGLGSAAGESYEAPAQPSNVEPMEESKVTELDTPEIDGTEESKNADDTTPADHLYDKGYKKWEKFDAEEAEKAVDDTPATTPPPAPTAQAAPAATPAATGEGDAWAEQAMRRARCIVETFDNVKIFMLGGPFEDVTRKAKFRAKFDAVYLANSSVHHMAKPEFNTILKPNAAVTCESSMYMVPLRQEQKNDFQSRVHGMAKRLGWEWSFDTPLNAEKPGGIEWDLRKPSFSYVYRQATATERAEAVAQEEQAAAAAAAAASATPAEPAPTIAEEADGTEEVKAEEALQGSSKIEMID